MRRCYSCRLKAEGDSLLVTTQFVAGELRVGQKLGKDFAKLYVVRALARFRA